MTAGEAVRLRCPDCARLIEACGCCEREDCPEPVCHRCLLFALRESIPQPHPHGG